MTKYLSLILGLLLSMPCSADIIQFEANESPPFWSKNMPHNGMCGEILQAMSEIAGLQSSIIFKPLKRLIEDTENNDVGNPEFYLQQNDFASIIPIAIYQSAFYYYHPQHPQGISLHKLSDLQHYKIGILKGTLSDQMNFKQQGILFETSYKQDSIFKKLKLGRIDLALEIDLVASQTLRTLYPNNKKDFSVIQLPNSTAPVALMINDNQPNAENIARRYKQALAKLIQSGRYQKIVQKYYGDLKPPANWLDQLDRFSRLYNFIEAE